MWLEHLLFGVNSLTPARGSVLQGKSSKTSLYSFVSLLFYTVSSSCECTFEIIDNTERDNEVKKLKEIKVCNYLNSSFFELRIRDCNFKGKRVINL